MKLKGRRIIVTGANQGLGLAAAGAFVAEGASVVICARDAQRLAQAERDLLAVAPAGSTVKAVPTDVSDASQVRALFEQALAAMGGLDVVLANAGVYGPKGTLDEIDIGQWDQAIRINLLGVMYCCREALRAMKPAGGGRILVSGGGGATKPMPGLSAYAASKAGVVRLAETLAIEAAPFGIEINAIAPGALNTRMLDEVLAAGPDKVGRAFYEAAQRQKASGGDSIQRAADLCVFLASDDSRGITGKLISAKWDPWQDLPCRAEDLKSDIYTLRRIVPADRGKNWGGS
ncbi:MAG: SDR family NAD(P)-dependent oxidoreductase [Phycisphaerae bacterium]